ncbi:MAG: penicillin-binding protein 1B, partial [Gammaproteobacteria bacterium]|nr:penicillin-binding protein 1B [Gammaproteobacteria bacterium]
MLRLWRNYWWTVRRGFNRGGFIGPVQSLFLLFIVFGIPLVVAYTIYLDVVVRAQFEGKRWEVPSRVYARPLELYTGRQISSQHLIEELEALRYRRFVSAEQPGTYKRVGNQFTIHLRPFEFHDGFRNAAQVTVTIENERVTRLIDENTQSKLELIRFDPLFIG